MKTHLIWRAGAATLLLAAGLQETPFVPHREPAYRPVNAVSFSADQSELFLALLQREVARLRGDSVSAATPEVALYRAQRTADGWSEPQLLPFSGRHEDYELTPAPDGRFFVFNSRRPYPDGRQPTRNDLWLVQRDSRGWNEPRRIDELSSFDDEESYATLSSAGRIVYHVGHANAAGTQLFDLFEAVLRDGRFVLPARSSLATDEFAEGDPHIAPDESWLIFTRWPQNGDWERSCDLYIAFRQGTSWSRPVALAELNTAGPDYAVTVSPDGALIYYRANHRYQVRPFAGLLAAARASIGDRGSGIDG